MLLLLINIFTSANKSAYFDVLPLYSIFSYTREMRIMALWLL